MTATRRTLRRPLPASISSTTVYPYPAVVACRVIGGSSPDPQRLTFLVDTDISSTWVAGEARAKIQTVDVSEFRRMFRRSIVPVG